MPEAVIIDDDEYVDWEKTDLAKKIQMNKKPGKILQAYRERTGLSIVKLAEITGIKYTNISAMEHVLYTSWGIDHFPCRAVLSSGYTSFTKLSLANFLSFLCVSVRHFKINYFPGFPLD